MPINAYPILMYHSIFKMPKGAIMRSLHVSPKRFNFQMRMLKFFGYRGVSMSELHHHLLTGNNEKIIGITFDDGYRNNVLNALPILKKLGFTATIYIVSKSIDGTNHWDASKGINEQQLLNKEEIHNWINSGMEIGSHTQTHKDLTKCSQDQLYKEITESKFDLENQFDIPIKHFCYPYGNFNESIIEIVKKAGYKTSTTTVRGRSKPTNNAFELPRVSITHHTLPHLFLMKIFTKYEDNHSI